MKLKALFNLLLLTTVLPSTVIAQGNLLVTPVRVIFEGQKKMQEINLANTGKDSAKYLVSLIEIRMNEDGTFDKISEPDSGQHFASSNLRYFPRTVVLAPGEAQLVKIQLTKTSQLATGEYRSHMYFRAVPNEKPLGEKLPVVKDSTDISVKLIPIFGISIPVIIRVGTSDTKMSIQHLALDSSLPNRLNMTFNRSGDFSVYGDVTVNYISPQGKTTIVGNVNGLAVYTPNSLRHFHMDLDTSLKNIDYHKGKLQVVFTTKKGETIASELAKAELPLH